MMELQVINYMESVIKVYKDSFNNSVRVELGNFLILVKKKKTCFTAFIPHFRTFGFGKTEKEALVDLKDALDIFFDVHIERGSIDKALLSFGWRKESNTFKKPKYFNSMSTLNRGTIQTLTYA